MARRLNKEKRGMIVDMRVSGMIQQEIADRLGMCQSTVSRVLKDEGYKQDIVEARMETANARMEAAKARMETANTKLELANTKMELASTRLELANTKMALAHFTQQTQQNMLPIQIRSM